MLSLFPLPKPPPRSGMLLAPTNAHSRLSILRSKLHFICTIIYRPRYISRHPHLFRKRLPFFASTGISERNKQSKLQKILDQQDRQTFLPRGIFLAEKRIPSRPILSHLENSNNNIIREVHGFLSKEQEQRSSPQSPRAII